MIQTLSDPNPEPFTGTDVAWSGLHPGFDGALLILTLAGAVRSPVTGFWFVLPVAVGLLRRP